jgi:hypothetical protein
MSVKTAAPLYFPPRFVTKISYGVEKIKQAIFIRVSIFTGIILRPFQKIPEGKNWEALFVST